MKNNYVYPQPQQIGGEICPVGGLTKLEYFAGLAMQGMITGNCFSSVKDAVIYAQLLVAELDRVQAENTAQK